MSDMEAFYAFPNIRDLRDVQWRDDESIDIYEPPNVKGGISDIHSESLLTKEECIELHAYHIKMWNDWLERVQKAYQSEK
jgi:hypothetical protein